MAQLIVARVRSDGEYDTVAAVQNNVVGLQVPALEWALQMKQFLEEDNAGEGFVILHADELADVTSGTEEGDVTERVKEAFENGRAAL